jgi:tetrapyrrole methylase family protein / MazG family protein
MSMQNFNDLVRTTSKSIMLDPWAKKRGLKGYCEEIRTEADEAVSAVSKKDYKNLEEELGDVLIDWCHACIAAEQQGLFTMNDVIKGAEQKLHRRKPYLKEGRKVSLKEAKEIWAKAKKAEKENERKYAEQPKLIRRQKE